MGMEPEITNVQALFEVPFDAASRFPQLPADADGALTLFNAPVTAGWNHVVDIGPTTTPTVLIRICTGAAVMDAHKINPDLLFVADIGSPVVDAAITATKARDCRDWLLAHGYVGAEFGLAMAAVMAARSRRALVLALVEKLHQGTIGDVEKQHIGPIVATAKGSA